MAWIHSQNNEAVVSHTPVSITNCFYQRRLGMHVSCPTNTGAPGVTCTWVLWHLKSPTALLSVHNFVLANGKGISELHITRSDNITTMYSPFMEDCRADSVDAWTSYRTYGVGAGAMGWLPFIQQSRGVPQECVMMTALSIASYDIRSTHHRESISK